MTPQSITGPTIGAILALSAFSVAIVAGMYSGNSATSVVGRALVAMIVCYPVGLGVGWIGRRVVHDHTIAHARSNPVPQVESIHAASSNAPAENEHEEAIVV